MSDENEKIERKVAQLRTTNAGLTQEIEQLGGGVEVTTARLEHFMQWICTELDIPKEKRLGEMLAWEQGLRTQLIPIRDKLKEHRQQQHDQMRRQQEAAEKAARRGSHRADDAPKVGLWTPGKN